jgi:hypothetical protein
VDEEKGIAMLTLREFIGPAPTIRVGGLSVTDQQIIAQHPSGATKVFEAGQLAEADRWWDEQDQLRDCNGR